MPLPEIPKSYSSCKNVSSVTSLPMFQKLKDSVEAEYESKIVFPPIEQVYSAMELTPLDEVKVVILGQDPYIGEGQAHGLAFSVNKGVRIPPSLANVFAEIKAHDGSFSPSHEGDLTHWAKQGVLLLNTILTVKSGVSMSHANRGWERLTDAIIKDVSEHQPHVVFMLWGQKAKDKIEIIQNQSKHLVLTAMHPSPLAKNAAGKPGFLGCDHFRKANQFLKSHKLSVVNW